MDPKDCSPSDAVLAVSRLLAPAGGSADAADVRSAVVERGARASSASPSALLLELAEADRRVARRRRRPAPAAPTASCTTSPRCPRWRTSWPAARARAPLDADRPRPLDRRARPRAPDPARGQLIAVGADVLLLAGAQPCACFDGDEQLGELFVNAAAAALGRRRTGRDARGAHGPPARAHARGEDAQRVARPRAAARPHLRGGDAACSTPTTPPSTAARRPTGFVVGGIAGLPPEFVGWPLRAGHRPRRPGRRARPPDAHQRLPVGRRRCRRTRRSGASSSRARGPVRLGRRAARRAQRRLGAPAHGRHRGPRGAGDLHRARRRRLPQRQRPRRPRAAPRRPTR